MKEKLQNLMTVKSIVTILLAVTFVILALTNRITGQEFLTIFTVIISFYFGTQHEKKVQEQNAVEGAGAEASVCPYMGSDNPSVSAADTSFSTREALDGGTEGTVVEV